MSNRIYKLLSDEKDRLSIENFSSYYEKIIEKAKFEYFLDNGIIQGFVAYYCNDVENKKGYITMVVVDPSYRNKGVGRTMVSSVLDKLKDKGFLLCELEVGETNTHAHTLYSNLGFFTIGKTENGKFKMRVVI